MTQNKDKMRQHLKRSGFGTKQSLFCRRAASLALFRRSLLTNPSASANKRKGILFKVPLFLFRNVRWDSNGRESNAYPHRLQIEEFFCPFRF